MDIVRTDDENREIEAIKFHFGIEDEMFKKGVHFASLVAEGSNRTKAFEASWNVSKEIARGKAGEFFSRKWIQELVRYFKPDEGTLYIGDIASIVKTGMEIINDPRRDDRVKIEAMKALQPYIKQQIIKTESEVTHTHEISQAETIMGKMATAINHLSVNGKMIGESGDIIDVEFVQ